MNNNLKNAIIVILLVVVAGLVLYSLPKKEKSGNNDNNNGGNQAAVDDFLSCAAAGYPVMESSPMQCRTPDGRLFVEDVSDNAGAAVVVSAPLRGEVVASPLTVTGQARGNWFFEANLPVTLKDDRGNILAQKGAQAQGDWMTTDYVNFTTVLEFEQPATQYGVLIIEKDNPSGLPENDESYSVPVRFQ